VVAKLGSIFGLFFFSSTFKQMTLTEVEAESAPIKVATAQAVVTEEKIESFVPTVSATPVGVPAAGNPPIGVPAAGIPGQVNLDRRSTPTRCVCPNCRQEVVSRIDYEPGMMTWCLSGFLCLIGCWLGCCMIPFCIDDCKDTIHTCPQCGVELGIKRAMN